MAAGFMSYAHIDDADKRLTELCRYLSQEVQRQTGEEFRIFQDRSDIGVGQQWRPRISESIDSADFLIAFLSPGFFKSTECGREVALFFKREKQLKRNDLILPIYFIDCPAFNSAKNGTAASLERQLANRQFADWREVRFEPLGSPVIGKLMAEFAKQVRDSLARSVSEPLKRRPSLKKPSVDEVGVRRSSGRRQTERAIAARPVSSKSAARIHVVDQKGGGEYTSIGDAIAQAGAGDRILVRPGIYTEALFIGKSLEVLGDGIKGDVVVQVQDTDVILFQATLGRVANLTIRQTGGGNSYAVDIAQGRLELEDCDITSASLACVAIHNGADPRLRRNTIHDGQRGGVLVYAQGLGTIEDNDLSGSGFCDITVMEGSNPTVRGNRIHHGTGVLIYREASGLFEDNDIYANDWSGLEIANGANPTVRRNRIHDNGNGGVFVYEDGKGTLEDNDIYGNDDTEVTISEGGNPILRRNRVHDSKAGGIFVHSKGRGILEDNVIYGNTDPGVEITTEGNPTLRRNHIRNGKREGVWVYDKGAGIFENNDIVQNAQSGVEISNLGAPTLVHNRIAKNAQWGIRVYDKGAGIIEDNNIRDNAHGAFKITADSKSRLRLNRNREKGNAK